MPLNQQLFVGIPPDPLVAYWMEIGPPEAGYVTTPDEEPASALELSAGERLLMISLSLILGLPLLLGMIAWILLGL